MIALEELLKNTTGLSGYKVNYKSTASYECFFVHDRLETVRATDTQSAEVTVYVDHDGFRGDSSFTVSPAMDENETKARIAAAKERCLLIDNEPYDLVPGGQGETRLPGNIALFEPKTLAREIAQAVFAAGSRDGCSLNACEIFIYTDTDRVINSRGTDQKQTLHRVMVEAIPTFSRGSESVELYEDLRFTDFDREKVTAEIAEKMREVRDRFTASRPGGLPMTLPVLLKPHEIRSLLMHYLRMDLHYASVYRHANLHSIGDELQKDTGASCDRITLTAAHAVPGSEDSAAFDADGTALRDVCVIREGRVENYTGPHRYGQYLGIEAPSGELRCCRLDPGTLTKDVMPKRYLECVSLSGLQVDLYSDYIGGEIRLGYLHENGRTLPVTGITMSGKLSTALEKLRLTQDSVCKGAYEGPSGMLLSDMQIL